MVVLKRDLLKSIRILRDEQASTVEEGIDRLVSDISYEAKKIGLAANTEEYDYCEEGRIASLIPGHTEKCLVVYNPEHTNWMRFVCLIRRMGNVNHYEFYQLSYAVKLPSAQTDLASSVLSKVKLFNNVDKGRNFWEAEIARIINGL